MAQLSDNEVTKLAALVLKLQDFVERLQNEGVQLTPEQRAHLDEMKVKRLCLVCNKPYEGEIRRGSHQSCYNGVRAQISQGRMSTQQAVDEGIYNPIADKPGRKGKFAASIERGKATGAKAAAQARKKSKKAGTNNGT